jgi:hypothetical protein
MFATLVIIGATITLMASGAGEARAQPLLSNYYELPMA